VDTKIKTENLAGWLHTHSLFRFKCRTNNFGHRTVFINHHNLLFSWGFVSTYTRNQDGQSLQLESLFQSLWNRISDCECLWIRYHCCGLRIQCQSHTLFSHTRSEGTCFLWDWDSGINLVRLLPKIMEQWKQISFNINHSISRDYSQFSIQIKLYGRISWIEWFIHLCVIKNELIIKLNTILIIITL